MLNIDRLGLSATVTSHGISAPDYQAILSTLTERFRQIYGSDAYLAPDSKDGQLIALIALAIHDANNSAIAVYNSFPPATAHGAGLSRNVKINGIQRKLATHSTVDLTLTGDVGTVILQGQVRDTNGEVWLLPQRVVIGGEGTALVTARCKKVGAISGVKGSINEMVTPTKGWYTVTNLTAASVGKKVETDAELRQRQSNSTAIPSMSTSAALQGALASIEGVTQCKIYENDTGITNKSGLPPHAIAVIVSGGDAAEIAHVLYRKKGQGVATYGTLKILTTDGYGNPVNIAFSRPQKIPIYVRVNIMPFTGYTTDIGEKIKQSISHFINQLEIGQAVLFGRLFSPADLYAEHSVNRHYDISDLVIGRTKNNLSNKSIPLAFNEVASGNCAHIEVVV